MKKDNEYAPLSLEQERMWVQSQMHGSNPAFHERGGAWLDGPLDIEIARAAIEHMSQRHEILRTTFVERDGQPVQAIHDQLDVAFRVVDSDVRVLREHDIDSSRIARDEVSTSFDIERGPLFRVCLMRFGAERHFLILTMHHLISDGDRSVSLFMEEFFFNYNALIRDQGSNFEIPSTRYRDHAWWQRRQLQGAWRDEHLAWWRDELSGAPHALDLPTDRPRPDVQTFAGALCERQIFAKNSETLLVLAREESCELFAAILAGLQAVLHRYSGQSDVLVGTPLPGRARSEQLDDDRPDATKALGYFGNPVVLRARFDKNTSFRDLLHQVQGALGHARAHGEVSFKDLVEALSPTRAPSRPPLFQVLFELRDEWLEPMIGESLTLTMVDVELPFVAYELMISVRIRGGTLSWRVEYNRDLFDEATIVRLLSHCEVLLSAAASDPDQSIARLPLLTADERELVLSGWNQSGYQATQSACLHHLFEQQVIERPDAIAAVCGAQELSYRALDTRANQLAHRLRARGVQPGQPVALFVERSLDVLIGILGILKAGGAYVPLDVDYPTERLAFMVNDVGAAIVITRGSLADRLPESESHVLCLDAHESMDDIHPDTDPRPDVTPQHPAYIIYTSGSTGQPKGVLVSHQNVVRLFDCSHTLFRFDSHDVWALFHSHAFDVSVWEIWGALLHGGRLVVVPYLVSRSPDEFHELLCRERVTVACQTPSAFYLLDRADAEAPLKRALSLRYVILAGEVFDVARARSWFERRGDVMPQLINMYGITETTVHSTYRRVRLEDLERSSASMVGRPLPDSRIYLLDEHLQPVPIGVPGEIHVSGPGVTMGYLGRSDLTTARFLADPFVDDGAWMYRSGDLGRFHADGDIEYLGRLDQQVKLRGFRVELGEIEAALLSHETILAAAVIAREDVPGDKYLAAYVVGEERASVSAETLLERLRQTLPEYMVPTAIVELEAMPLNPNGKLDRRALPQPSNLDSRSEREWVAPRTPMERELCAMAGDVLRLPIDRVGVHDNFFALGGHSLRAIELMARIRRRFDINVPLRAFFSDSTVAGLASRLERLLDERRDQEVTVMEKQSNIAHLARVRTVSASSAQRRLWFLHQVAETSSVYNYPAFFRLRGPLDVNALRSALRELVQRHESLRTWFVEENAEIVQKIAASVSSEIEATDIQVINLRVVDLRELAERERENQMRRYIDAEAQRPFDLASAPLMRTSLLSLANDDHVLCLNLHHIVTDGWSMSVLYRELSALYQDLVKNRSPSLGEPAEQYADHVAQRETWTSDALSDSLDWWRDYLEGAPSVLDLPSDHTRPLVQDFRGSSVPLVFSHALGQQLQALAADANATPNMVLFAVFAALLHRYTGRDDLLVGLPYASRERPELAHVVGMLVNTLVVRCDLTGDPRFRELIDRVRATSLAVYEHAGVPFEQLVHALRPERDASRNPLVQVVFAPQTEARSRPELPGLTVEVLPFEQGKSNFELTFYVWFDDQEIVGTLEYSTSLFERATIERMAQHLNVLVESAVRAPDARISTLTLLPEHEQNQVLEIWNDTAFESNKTRVHQRVADHATRTPDAVALRQGDACLTYGEFDRRANKLANRLKTLGVGVETTVGLFIPRCIDMVVSALAVLRAGGAYLPLDPAHPDARIRFALADAKAAVVLTLADLAHRLRLPYEGAIVRVDTEWPDIERESDVAPADHGRSDNLAYIIYTSGSTGKPKGVEIEHRGLSNLVSWHVRAFSVTSCDRAPLFASPAFDASVWETWPYLCAGACLDIPDDDIRYDADALKRWLLEREITIAFVTTAMGEQMLQRPWPRSTTLRSFLVGGDRMKSWPREDLPFEVINNYGPTENTVVATSGSVSALGLSSERSVEPPIGAPIANTRIYVLDAHGNPVPIGVPGELFIGGVGVARGYVNRPELTSARFSRDPFSSVPGARMYRTGDRARWRPDGTVEFLGRLDHQVKIRGFRIELGEIESVLVEHSNVREAVVVPREVGASGSRLVAYVVLEGDRSSVHDVREFARQRLPEYMIPALFVDMVSLPRNTSGKVECDALPLPDECNTLVLGWHAVRESERPEGLVSRIAAELLEIWRAVLGVERVGLHDAFFDLGGHSLLLAQVRSQVRSRLGVELSMVALFQLPTIDTLARHLSERIPTDAILREIVEDARSDARPMASRKYLDEYRSTEPERVELALPELRVVHTESARDSNIAIVGMSGRFPGASDVPALWRLLCAGQEGISRFTHAHLERAGGRAELLSHPRFVPAVGIIEEPAHFDARFFGYSARDAELMDPQHRWFLSCAWLALEHAGYDANRYPGSIGLFGGGYVPWYWLERLTADAPLRGSAEEYRILLGNSSDFLVGRVAYKLGLCGPCANVQTACSTSLTAVHLACRSLLARECDMALAGASSIAFMEPTGYVYEPGGGLSPDGHCRPFDAQAQGTVLADAVAMVVLKRLDDALADSDTIYAVIRGSAVNNDGARKIGYTAPSVEAQAEVIRRAHAVADVSPHSIGYVEAHGTGTPLGDPIEVAALQQVFGRSEDLPSLPTARCALGSAKSNLGHTGSVAGVIGLIKAALALHHELIPPTLHFKRANPELNLHESRFFVAAEAIEWPRGATPRRAGVSALGLGGTNVHIVLEEAPKSAPTLASAAQPWQLLVISAKSAPALEATCSAIAEHLAEEARAESPRAAASLADIASTLQVGRAPFKYRRALVCRDPREAASALTEHDARRVVDGLADERPRVVFMFPGGGTQSVAMGAGLYGHEPAYREAFDRCAVLFKTETGRDIRSIMFSGPSERSDERLMEPSLMSAAIACTEYALAQLLSSWGVTPDAVMGHSLGEYIAAHLAGVLTLPDAVALMALRASLHEQAPAGTALVVHLPEGDLAARLPRELSIAAINSPRHAVVSGTVAAIESFEARLRADGVHTKRLAVARAPHSALIEPAMAPLTERAMSMSLSAPSIPIISNVKGTWMSAADALDPGYWAKHLRRTVRFADGVCTICDQQNTVVLEVGPGNTLSALTRMQPGLAVRAVLSTMADARGDGHADLRVLLSTLGQLWCAGVDVTWSGLHRGETRRRVPVPSRPFELRRHLLEPAQRMPARPQRLERSQPLEPAPERGPTLKKHTADRTLTSMLADIWQELLGVDEVRTSDDFFDLGGSSLLAVQMCTWIEERLGARLSVHALLAHPTFGQLCQATRDARDLSSTESVTTVELKVEPEPDTPLAFASRSDASEDRAIAAAGAPSVVTREPLLTCIQKGAPHNLPLFLVQPTGGTAYAYLEFVRCMSKEQPVYAFRASGFKPGEPIHDDVVTMARCYVEELIDASPEGPYLLGGYSSGATVAYEMACQLKESGRDLALLCLMDAFTPAQAHALGVHDVDDWPSVVDEFKDSAPDEWRALRAAFEQDRVYREIAFSTYRALASYLPQPLRCDVLYLRSTDRGKTLERHPETWWMDLVDGCFAAVNTPGNHYTMLRPPHVDHLASVLSDYVRRAVVGARGCGVADEVSSLVTRTRSAQHVVIAPSGLRVEQINTKELAQLLHLCGGLERTHG